MPYYAESGFERIVDVHWKRKDDEPEVPPDYPFDPCGQTVIPTPAPFIGSSRWFMDTYQPMAIIVAGIDLGGKLTGKPPNYTVNEFWPAIYEDQLRDDLYYWGLGARAFQIKLEPLMVPYVGDTSGGAGIPWDHWWDYVDKLGSSPAGGGGGGGGGEEAALVPIMDPIGIDIYRGIDPNFVKLDDAPSETIVGSGSVSCEIPNDFYTFVGFWGGPDATVFGRRTTRSMPLGAAKVTIQAICDNQTTGGPPPQPHRPPPPGSTWYPFVRYPISPPESGGASGSSSGPASASRLVQPPGLITPRSYRRR